MKNKNAEPEDQKDENLEDGLEETFPGSDPVTISQPGKKGDDPEAGGR